MTPDADRSHSATPQHPNSSAPTAPTQPASKKPFTGPRHGPSSPHTVLRSPCNGLRCPASEAGTPAPSPSPPTTAPTSATPPVLSPACETASKYGFEPASPTT